MIIYCPLDGQAQALVVGYFRSEPQFVPGLSRISEALSRSVPLTSRLQGNGGRVPGQRRRAGDRRQGADLRETVERVSEVEPMSLDRLSAADQSPES